MKRQVAAAELKAAGAAWRDLSAVQELTLNSLLNTHCLSVIDGHVQLLDGKVYVTHSGLLHIAYRNRCIGIDVRRLPRLCDPTSSRWVFKATVYKSAKCRGFVGYGDADPSNVSPLVRGAEMRVAETRAVNRALRKAYGIGLCSVEELSSLSGPPPSARVKDEQVDKPESVNTNGHSPLRDRLRLLIRKRQLDPALVKAYAAAYCDVSDLRQATRDQIASFIQHLADFAQNDREGLLCQLNSYARKPICPATPSCTGDSSGGEQEKEIGAA